MVPLLFLNLPISKNGTILHLVEMPFLSFAAFFLSGLPTVFSPSVASFTCGVAYNKHLEFSKHGPLRYCRSGRCILFSFKDNIKEEALIELTGPKGEDIMMGEA